MATRLISWIAQAAVAALFLFTGVYKLAGNADAQATFAAIGGAPVMYLTGLLEIVGAVLIALPRTRAVGGVFAMGVMGGAIASHAANLVPNHEMLPLAVVLFIAGGVVAWLHRGELPVVGARLASGSTQAPATAG